MKLSAIIHRFLFQRRAEQGLFKLFPLRNNHMISVGTVDPMLRSSMAEVSKHQLQSATSNNGRDHDSPPMKIVTREHTSRARPVSRSLKDLAKGKLLPPGLAEKALSAFEKVFTPELVELNEICTKHGMTIRMAGGAPRDIIQGILPHDIDFATTTSPEKMVEIFTSAEVRMLEYGSRAIEHGTVTVRINDKENYEITTTRSDTLTDGRHAKAVEFHQDWERDANRRDLTVNSMFLDLNGILYDYFDGFHDLINERVRFVGEADERIQEDYLRIMRYFRFYGRIKSQADEHDDDTLSSIRRNAAGLAGIAGERIWVELKKILKGKYADHLVKIMSECGVTQHIGLPEHGDDAKLTQLYSRSEDYDITEAAVLSAYLRTTQEVEVLHKRLKMSKLEYTTMLYVIENRSSYRKGNSEYYKHLIVDSSSERTQCHKRCIQLAAYMNDRTVYDSLRTWDIPTLPFSAKVFIELGIPKGKKLSLGVGIVKQKWKDSNFTATSEELADYARQVVQSGQLS